MSPLQSKLTTPGIFLLLMALFSLSACKVNVDQSDGTSRNITDIYNGDGDADGDGIPDRDDNQIAPDPCASKDCSVPQYTDILGQPTNGRHLRMNRAMDVLQKSCLNCHGCSGASCTGSTVRTIDQSQLYSEYYWLGLNQGRPHQWIFPGDPRNGFMSKVEVPSQIYDINVYAEMDNTTKPYDLARGSRDMPCGKTDCGANPSYRITYDDFRALYDWVKYINAPTTTHVVRIPYMAGGAAFTSTSSFFTAVVGDDLIVHNDDIEDHRMTGNSAWLFENGTALGPGEWESYTVLSAGSTKSLVNSSAFDHRVERTANGSLSNFHFKAVSP